MGLPQNLPSTVEVFVADLRNLFFVLMHIIVHEKWEEHFDSYPMVSVQFFVTANRLFAVGCAWWSGGCKLVAYCFTFVPRIYLCGRAVAILHTTLDRLQLKNILDGQMTLLDITKRSELFPPSF